MKNKLCNRMLPIALAVTSSLSLPSGAGVLEEVVVTAQKRAESAQDVPISISAFTGESLADAGITSSEDLSLVTPGLNITQSGVASVVFVRGVGNPDSSAAQEQAVGTYIDGVWFGSVTGSWMELNSVERVEVLKGPQGTLFGRNTTGGVINITTKDPSEETAADISATFGNYDYAGADFYGTTGITDNLAADLTLSYEHQDEGFGDNLAANKELEAKQDAIFARTKWKYSGDSFDVTASVFYEKYDDPRGHNRRMPEGSFSINGESAPSDFHDISGDLLSQGEYENQGASLRITKSFNNFDFVSITGWLDNDAEQIVDGDSSGFNFLSQDIDFYQEQLSQEFQLISNNTDSNFSWIGGLYLLDVEGTGYYGINGAAMQIPALLLHPDFGLMLGAPGTPLVAGGSTAFDSEDPLGAFLWTMGVPFGGTFAETYAFGSTIETQSIALYGEIGYDLTDITKLTVGLRWTQDDRELTGGWQYWCDDGSADPVY